MNWDELDDEGFLDLLFDRAVETTSVDSGHELELLLDRRPHLRQDGMELLARARRLTARVPSVQTLLPGYELVREVARGALGQVWLARQSSAGARTVAVKILPTPSMFSTGGRRRFLAESRTLAGLRHPHIVTLHEVLEHEEYLAYVMEWIEGPNLGQLITELVRGQRYPTMLDIATRLDLEAEWRDADSYPHWVTRLGIALAGALSCVHDAGFLHRDVKPSNVLVRSYGAPVLTDFGLVRSTSGTHQTRQGLFIGTAQYAAPEQLRGDHESTDSRADIYGLGATLYQALALRTPFPGLSGLELLRAKEGGEEPPIWQLQRGVSKDLSFVVRKAMANEPDERYATASEFGEDLHRAMEGRAIRGSPPGLAKRIRQFIKRRRESVSVVLVTLFVALVLGGVLIGAVIQRLRAPELAQEAMHRGDLLLMSRWGVERALTNALGLRWRPVSRESQTAFLVRLEGAAMEFEKASQWAPGNEPALARYCAVRLALPILRGSERLEDLPDPKLTERFPLLFATARAARMDTWTAPDQEIAAGYGDRLGAAMLAFLLADHGPGPSEFALEVWPFLFSHKEGDFLSNYVGGIYAIAHQNYAAAALHLKDVYQASQEKAVPPSAAMMLADASIFIGQLEEAQSLMDEVEAYIAEQTDPDEIEWFSDMLSKRRALMMSVRGKHEQAAEVYDELSLRRRGVIFARYRAQNDRDRGRPERALRHLWSCLEQDLQGAYLGHVLIETEHWWQGLAFSERWRLLRAALDGESRVFGSLLSMAERVGRALEWESQNGATHLYANTVRDLEASPIWWARELQRYTNMYAQLINLSPFWKNLLVSRLVVGREVHRPAFLPLAGLLLAATASLPSGQRLLHHVEGSRANAGVGWGFCAVDDVDGDGLPDLAVSHRSSDEGRIGIEVLSSTRGKRVYSIPRPSQATSVFGLALIQVADLDSDGVDEILAGDYAQSAVYLYSGQDGVQLPGSPIQGVPGDNFGRTLARLDDVNGNGTPDFAVGADQGGQAGSPGYVVVYDGSSLEPIHTIVGNADDHLGIALASGDVDGDGLSDLIIGGDECCTSIREGLVEVYDLSGPAPVLHWRADGAVTGDRLGRAVACVGDLNGDGCAEVVGGAIGDDPSGETSGSVRLWSGSDGTLIHMWPGTAPSDNFGLSVASGGDWNGDGVGDVLVGASQRWFGNQSPGFAALYSGAPPYEELHRFTNSGVDDWFGDVVTHLGDLNGDGWDEIGIGNSREDNVHGSQAGELWVFGPPRRTLSFDSQADSPLVTGLGMASIRAPKRFGLKRFEMWIAGDSDDERRVFDGWLDSEGAANVMPLDVGEDHDSHRRLVLRVLDSKGREVLRDSIPLQSSR